MIQRLAVLIVCILGTASLPTGTYAADGPPVSDVDERTFEQTYHIPLTEDGLIAALGHARGDVRSFAALKLAALGEKDAIPSILMALANETVPGTQVSLALAVARLGSDAGVIELRRMCRDSSRSSFRMAAAQAMLDVGHEDCFEDVLDVIRLQQNSQEIIQALYLLPKFKHVPEGKQPELQSLAVLSLNNEMSSVRMAAGYVLTEIGDSATASAALRSAIGSEQDSGVRTALEADLRARSAK